MAVKERIRVVEDYVQVSAALLGLVQQHLEQQSIVGGELRAKIANFSRLERVPIDTWWQILDSVASIDPAPCLGIRIGLMTRPHHVGVLGYLCMACETFEETLGFFQRFQPLLQNLTPLTLSPFTGGMRLTWDKTYGKSTQHSTDVLVGITLAFARAFTGFADVNLSAVSFPGLIPANQREEYRRLLNCPVSFGADCLSLDLATQILQLPLKTQDSYMQTLMVQQATTLMATLPHPDALMAQVKQAVEEALKEGESSKQSIAERMGVSPGFLLRCLKRRNLTFTVVVNAVRRQCALTYLRDQTLTLCEVAQLLGYSEQSAFTRAFRVWYDLTPLRYRREQSKSHAQRPISHV